LPGFHRIFCVRLLSGKSFLSFQVIICRAFSSRLILGTGKYRSFQEMARAHAASGADMVTVAVRRVNLTDQSKESLLDFIPREKIFILPNTAGCYTADEAVRTARLAQEVGLSNWVKLEVIGDQQTLYPDTEQLIEATKILVKEGFVVLPYTNDDLIAARKLIDAGAAAVMPLAAPIGSGLGVQNPAALRILRERITEVPLIVDAGVGTASDAAVAMELGADGILMNTAIAEAADSVLMAEAIRNAQQLTGKKAVNGEDVRRGFESLDITPARLKELGMEGFAAPVKLSCADHNGHGGMSLVEWDGTKWNTKVASIAPIKDKVLPLINSTAEEYVKANAGWPKRTEPCDKSS